MTSRLGKGGMSHVFLATQHSFERQVAIKILTPTLALEPRFAERFMQEARTVASLNHPHIVPVYDVGEHQGYYYLTMEYVTGGSLKQRLADDALDESHALSILRQLAGALNYAGEHGFIQERHPRFNAPSAGRFIGAQTVKEVQGLKFLHRFAVEFRRIGRLVKV